MLTVMTRTDVEAGMDRWYMVAVQPTLFEPLAIICSWGSRQTTWQQLRIFPAASPEEAAEEARRIVRQKLRRGYHIVWQE